MPTCAMHDVLCLMSVVRTWPDLEFPGKLACIFLGVVPQLQCLFPVIAFVYRDGVRDVLSIRCVLSADVFLGAKGLGKVVLI